MAGRLRANNMDSIQNKDLNTITAVDYTNVNWISAGFWAINDLLNKARTITK